MDRCIITFSSPTYAIKAQKILKANSISCELFKLNSKDNLNGCAQGLAVNCSLLSSAAGLIMKNGVHYNKLIRQ